MGSPVKDFLDSVTGHAHDSALLVQAIQLIEEMNEAMEIAAGALAPLGDIDFHGKWRIKRALHVLGMRDQGRASTALADRFITQMLLKSPIPDGEKN